MSVAVSWESLDGIDPDIAAILERALGGRELTEEEGTCLFRAEGVELAALTAVADHLRRQRVGDRVTYVVNRNINFTNVCNVGCRFCAFSRGPRSPDASTERVDVVVRKAVEAAALGATEVCIQGGINPSVPPEYYVEICRAIKAAVPSMHIHAFSPEEIRYIAEGSGWGVEESLRILKESGLGTLPGTAAEILDDEVRRAISPRRIGSDEWCRIVRTAHRLGLPTTSTMMYGHVESPRHRVRHMITLRDINRDTGGITEFVPMVFVSQLTRLGKVIGTRPIAREEHLRVYAISRLMLNNWIPNVQVTWVKLGPLEAREGLMAGANDYGGTLMEENISRLAGASHGQYVSPEEFHRLIREIGRIPAERSTTYQILREFPGPLDDPYAPNDGAFPRVLG
jgi:FO synthase